MTPEPGAEGGPLLAVQRLVTSLPTAQGPLYAVDGVSFTLGHGESLGIIGESGSGKSMLCRSIVGLAPARARTTGAVAFAGVDLLTASPKQLRGIRGGEIGMVLQNPATALNPVVRIGRQITETLGVHLGYRGREARARAIELLGQTGVPDPARRIRSYPHELSGGLRQRVCIAIAVAAEPKVLLADEPTTALDVTIQRQVLDLLTTLCAGRGMSMVLVSHDLGVVAGRTGRVLVMYGGRIVETGPTRQIFRAARHPYTAALLAAVPRLRRPGHSTLAEIPGSPLDALGSVPGCRFAPRCPRVQPVCLREAPALTAQAGEPGHLAACFNPVGAAPARLNRVEL